MDTCTAAGGPTCRWNLSETSTRKAERTETMGESVTRKKDGGLHLRPADSMYQGHIWMEEGQQGWKPGERSGLEMLPLRDHLERQLMLGWSDHLNNSKIRKCAVTCQEKIHDLGLMVVTHYTVI